MNRLLISTPTRIALGVFTLLGFACYAYAVCSVWRADWLQDQQDRASLEASARLQPWNAQTQWLLGRYFLNGAQDYTNALKLLQRSVDLDPYEGRYWVDLAAVHQVRGEAHQSQEVLERALRAEPTSIEIAWETANFYLAQNDTNRALPLFRVTVQYDPNPSNTLRALDLSWRSTKSVSRIVSQVLPSQAAPYFAFLKLLVAGNQSGAANELWRDLIAQKFIFSAEEAFLYFDYLIQTQQIDQAKEVWTDLSKVHPELQDDVTTNLVLNGGFETEFLNGGFEWRSRQAGLITILLDTNEVHRGSRALQITFAGPAVSDTGVYQYVPVQPSTAYRFGAYVKTRDIVTASGPRLAVEDSSTGKVLATTDEFLETNGWSEHTAEFVTGTDTHMVILRIVRIPGNPLIKGTFWIDDVELTPTPPARRATP